ncbi:hypothetical protein Tco_0165862, partial [Tanacetum coccineum]
KDYDEEREMEPRPKQTRKVTPPLRTRLPRVRRQRERVVGFEESPNREGSRTRRIIEGNRHSEAGKEENGRREMNLPPLGKEQKWPTSAILLDLCPWRSSILN